MSQISLKIKPYGILNRYISNGEALLVSVPSGCTVSHLKEALFKTLVKNNHSKLSLEQQLDLQKIIMSSVFAKDDRILEVEAPNLHLNAHDVLAILPPVCGG